MKKNLIIIGILILLKSLLPIKQYVELNHLKIIKEIIISCDQIYYKEVIPEKDDNKIEYRYKIYNQKEKNFYLDKAKIKNTCKKKR